MEPTRSIAKPENVCITKLGGEEIRCLKNSMIYGANASGKSTLIRFINGLVQWIQCRDLLNRSLFQSSDIPIYDPFKFNKKNAHAESSFEIEFITQGRAYFYEVSFGKNIVTKEKLSFRDSLKEEYKVIYIRNEKDVTILYPDESEFLRKGLYDNYLLLSKAITSIEDPLLSPAADYISSIIVYYGLSDVTTKAKEQDILQWLINNKDIKSRILTLFKEIGTNIKDLVININEEEKITGVHDCYDGNKKIKPETLPFSKESEGSKSLLFLTCYLYKALSNGYPVFVDSLESNLHPIIAKILVLLFNEPYINPKNAQLIFTTHDMNLPDLCHARKDQIWFTEKSNRGISKMFPLSDFKDMPENFSFQEWYINERFEGVPKMPSLKNLW